MKYYFCSLIGAIGSIIASLMGGWNESITTLFIVMVIDFTTGLMVAGIFHKSKKTESGALESNACFKGICKKVLILFFVLIGHRVDLMIGTDYIRNAVCIAYICSDTISIIENAGLMGLPVPQAVINMIDILKRKEGDLIE